ncbi:autotransporter outer membrane beta-barrel domain-containing protein, partial [Xenorhabdus innexi]
GAVTLEKMGGGTLVFAADNNYSGGTKVTQGTLQLGNGGTQGNLFGDIALGSQGALAFNHSNDRVFGGNITGQGSLIKNGNNALVLTGKNSYTGVTEIQQGTFRQGKENAFSADSSYLTGEKTFFDMGGFNTTISGLNHSGHLSFGGDDNAVGRTLTATGDYNGKNGTLNLATKLAGDDSPTDRFVVNGNTSGTTHLVVKNVGGEGAPTHKGIKVVEVNGLSNGEFNLVGDYHHQGDPVIVAGAYAYRLDKDGTDHSWHLRSSKNYKPANPTQPTPPNQLYHAGVSLYEAYGQVLQTLNSPGTLYDRIDSREDRLNNAGSNNVGNDDKNTRSSKAWGRVTGTYGKLSPHKSTSGAENITYYMTRAQVGVDNRLYENDQGAIDGGVFLQYSHINADVGSEHGKGNIRSKGYTVGGTGTWYGHNGFYLGGLAQMTYFSSDLNSKTAGKHLGEEKAALGYALSLEAGQRINLTPTWSFTPQAQLAYSSIRMDDFHDVFKTKVHFGQSNNMKLRVGSVLDYRPKWRDGQNKDKKSPHLYGLFNVRQELLGDSDSAHVANKAFSSRNDRLWGEVGAGGAYSWNNGKYVVYSQTSVNTSLNNAADNYEINAKLGLKIAW